MLSFSAEEESVQVKPRARSTASGKKIPAGAISIFGGIFFSDIIWKWLGRLDVTKQVYLPFFPVHMSQEWLASNFSSSKSNIKVMRTKEIITSLRSSRLSS